MVKFLIMYFFFKDEAHSNVLQRTSLALPSLPTLFEDPIVLDEAQEKGNNRESESKINIKTEKDGNWEKEKEIKCDEMLIDKLLNREDKTISNKPNSLFPTKTGQPKAETEVEVEQQKTNILEKEEEIKHTKSNKPHSLFPSKVGQPKKEPGTKHEQEKTSSIVKNQAVEWSHTVWDLLEEDESDEEEEIRYLHILPQTLLETKGESICIPRSRYAAPKVAQEETDDLEKEKEIEQLRALAETLLERERNLEVQMLEYYGLKEQEGAMKEMENLLKTNSTETKFLSLKVESLEEENEKLKNQILELEKVTNKLDRNKEKIKMLKKRFV
jgi:hypothetical protein